MVMPEFKTVMKRITCKLCHYTGDYDLLRAKSDPSSWSVYRLIVLCKQCRRKMNVRVPDEMLEYTVEEVE